jgi:hypothetical protein
MDLKVDYLTHRRKNVPPHAVYSLFITIDSNKMFNIENRAFMRKVNKQVHKGDHITVYYPTGIYKILCFGFAHKANQLDLSNRVIFDFSNEKKQAWSLIEIDLVVIGLSCYLWFYLRKGIIQSQ